MKVKLLQDIEPKPGLYYEEGQEVFVSYTDDGKIMLGGRDGVSLEFGVDFYPIWNEVFLREILSGK